MAAALAPVSAAGEVEGLVPESEEVEAEALSAAAEAATEVPEWAAMLAPE